MPPLPKPTLVGEALKALMLVATTSDGPVALWVDWLVRLTPLLSSDARTDCGLVPAPSGLACAGRTGEKL